MDGNNGIEVAGKKQQSLMHAIYERYKEFNGCLNTTDSTSMFLMIGGPGGGGKNHETPNSSSSSSPISDDADSPLPSATTSAIDSCISFYIPTAYSPRKSPESGFVVASCSLVMSDQYISHIGDSQELERSCQNVLELDLAKNHLCHWNEVKKLLVALKRLRLLNLSQNPLLSSLDAVATVMSTMETSSSDNKAADNLYASYFGSEWSVHLTAGNNCFDNLRILILNSCYADLKLVQCLLEQFANLNELHLASNSYSHVTFDDQFVKPSLKILYFNNNELASWREVCKLGKCFPNLENLVISHNNISTFSAAENEENDNDDGDIADREEDDDDLCTSKCFRQLQILILNRLKINDWSVIDQLRQFPLLRHVRIQNVPLLDKYNEEEKYYMLVAHLDESVLSLNGSEITSDERETCERKFIRHYMDAAHKPARYFELETKHGKLDPLANVNLDVGKRVHVKLMFKEKHVYERVDVRQTVGEFKKHLEKFTGYPSARLRVYYIDVEAINVFGPEEMKHANRCLHSFNIRDGDEFEIDLKAPPPPPPQIVHVSQSDSSFVHSSVLNHTPTTCNTENLDHHVATKTVSPRSANLAAARASGARLHDQQNIRCSGNNNNNTTTTNDYCSSLNRKKSTKSSPNTSVNEGKPSLSPSATRPSAAN